MRPVLYAKSQMLRLSFAVKTATCFIDLAMVHQLSKRSGGEVEPIQTCREGLGLTLSRAW
jgi:hypothetical protein